MLKLLFVVARFMEMPHGRIQCLDVANENQISITIFSREPWAGRGDLTTMPLERDAILTMSPLSASTKLENGLQ